MQFGVVESFENRESGKEEPVECPLSALSSVITRHPRQTGFEIKFIEIQVTICQESNVSCVLISFTSCRWKLVIQWF